MNKKNVYTVCQLELKEVVESNSFVSLCNLYYSLQHMLWDVKCEEKDKFAAMNVSEVIVPLKAEAFA